jgi:hypothetical protein
MPPEADLIRSRHVAAAARQAIGFVAGHSRVGLRLPCQVQGPGDQVFTVEATFASRNDVFRISPTTLALARRTGFTGDHLSHETPVKFLATLV